MDNNDLINRFRYHPAETPDIADSHQQVRTLCLDLSFELNKLLPESREKSLAITHLEEVMMWANKAIACHS